MTRFLTYFLSIFISIFIFSGSTYAQEEGVLIADVDIQNAQVIVQDNNVAEVYFDLTAGSMAQSGIKYGVQVWSTEDIPTLVHEVTSDEVVNLSINESVPVEISFQVPEWLAGSYTLQAVSFSAEGLPFSASFVSELEFSGTGEYIEIVPGSCVLMVDGAVSPVEEVTIIEDEQNASFTCSVVSHFADPVDVSAATLVFEGSTFGTGVGAFPEGRTLTFEPEEEKEVSFVVPKQTTGGVYEHKVFFEYENMIVSNPVFYAYSTNIFEATILNVTTDKQSYKKGEEMHVNVFASGTEDVFVDLEVFAADGDICIEEGVTQMLPAGELETTFITPIATSCDGAVVSVTLTTDEGRVLASTVSGLAMESDAPIFPLKEVGIGIAVVIILILVYLLIFRNKKEEVVTAGVLFFAFFLFGIMSVPTSADAKTWSKNFGNVTITIANASLNKSSYTVGSTIRAAASGYAYGTCCGAHGGGPIEVSVSTSGSSGSWSGSGSASLRAPSSNGSYNVTFSAGWSNWIVNGSIGYTVTGATPAPNATLSASPSSITSGSNSTLSWSSSNATSCSGSGSGFSTGGSTSGTDGVSPSSTTTYRVTCTGPGGSDSASARVTVSAAAPSANLSASPSSITSGNSSRLSWSSSNATSCSGSGFSTGGNTSGYRYVSPSSTTNYSVTCTGSGGSDSDSARVTVSTPSPSVSLSASPSTISSGGSSTLSWSSSNATSCSGSGSGFSTGGSTSGTDGVSPSSTRTYTVTCSGPGGNDSDTARVTVNVPSPSVNLTADDTSITQGESTTLRWSSSNASSCSGSGSGFSTGGSTSGTDRVSPGSSTTYSITCTGTGGSDSDSVTISVSSPPPSPTASLEVRNTTQGGSWTSSNITIIPGDQISLRWDSTNASSCSGSNFSTGGADDGTTSSVTEPSAGNQTTYGVSCTGSGGSDSDTLRVTAQAQDPSLSANNERVRQGESVTLSYDMEGNSPASCSLTGPGVSYLAGSFSQQTGSIDVTVSGDSTYTLSCTGGSEEVSIELIPVVFDS